VVEDDLDQVPNLREKCSNIKVKKIIGNVKSLYKM
jgi:hypothetical protein